CMDSSACPVMSSRSATNSRARVSDSALTHGARGLLIARSSRRSSEALSIVRRLSSSMRRCSSWSARRACRLTSSRSRSSSASARVAGSETGRATARGRMPGPGWQELVDDRPEVACVCVMPTRYAPGRTTLVTARESGYARNHLYRRGDLSHVARTMRVLDELRGFRRGRRLSEIAAQLGASERTIRRDLADLRSAGFEIESLALEGRAAARLVERTYSSIAITRRERYTLLAIASLFDVLRGTPLWEDVSSLTRKLEQRMTPDERAEHATLGDRFAYVPDGGTKAYEGKEDVLDALLTGVLSRRVVKFAYRDARGRARGGHLAPY